MGPARPPNRTRDESIREGIAPGLAVLAGPVLGRVDRPVSVDRHGVAIAVGEVGVGPQVLEGGDRRGGAVRGRHDHPLGPPRVRRAHRGCARSGSAGSPSPRPRGCRPRRGRRARRGSAWIGAASSSSAASSSVPKLLPPASSPTSAIPPGSRSPGPTPAPSRRRPARTQGSKGPSSRSRSHGTAVRGGRGGITPEFRSTHSRKGEDAAPRPRGGRRPSRTIPESQVTPRRRTVNRSPPPAGPGLSASDADAGGGSSGFGTCRCVRTPRRGRRIPS